MVQRPPIRREYCSGYLNCINERAELQARISLWFLTVDC